MEESGIRQSERGKRTKREFTKVYNERETGVLCEAYIVPVIKSSTETEYKQLGRTGAFLPSLPQQSIPFNANPRSCASPQKK